MFVRKPRSSEAREGDTVIIACEVVGDPKPDVYWLRDFLKVYIIIRQTRTLHIECVCLSSDYYYHYYISTIYNTTLKNNLCISSAGLLSRFVAFQTNR